MNESQSGRNPRKTESAAEAGRPKNRRLSASGEPATPPETSQSVGAILREWSNALVVAFVATMFFRIFMVELFKIPSGSMTPTLIGGRIAYADVNHDGNKELVLFQNGQATLVFMPDGRQVKATPEMEPALEEVRSEERFDRILVNKMAYWFHQPARGDIVVFKVPPAIFSKDKSIYIKRCVGLPGEQLSFDGDGHLQAGGNRVREPDFFDTQRYTSSIDGIYNGTVPGISYTPTGSGQDTRIDSIRVPPGQIYVFGDNTNSSYDSRYWGGVALNNVKGRAFLRYWPPTKMRIFKGS